MTQQPFSRPGAIDLSALKRPAGGPPAANKAGGSGEASGTSYSLAVDEDNFQAVIEASMTAPVLLVFFSRSRMPESGELADDLATLSGEFEGRFLAGLVDIDASPSIAQAMQIPSIPLVVVVLDGRPMPMLQDVLPLAELRTALTEVTQQFATQGVTARHQPQGGAAAPVENEEPAEDPRYAAAQAALGDGDLDRAVAEYQKLLDANPADTEAAAGLTMAKALRRTQGVDVQAARTAADQHPDDLDAQSMLADLDLLDGRVEEAFSRLIELVCRSAGVERTQARDHLLGLFMAVGNDDPRVLKGRQNLASALF